MSACIDCGISISNNATRCKTCSNVYRSGERSATWKGATICPKCGGYKDKGAQICLICHQNKILKYTVKDTICPECGNHKTVTAQICRECRQQTAVGENSPTWKGGISFFDVGDRKNRNLTSFEYATWRLQVFTRDNFTCQHCQKSNKLNAHHIQNFTGNENLQLEVDNGVTLCKKCHNLFHSLFGNKNNNLGQLEWFFKNVKLYKGV